MPACTRYVHENFPNTKVFLHSCGAIVPLIPHLIEAGVDILNPVQITATGMDPRTLKREFGKKLTFWGRRRTDADDRFERHT